MFFGVGTSSVIAIDASCRFSQIGIVSSYCADVLFMNVTAANLQKEDAAVCISHSGATKATVDAMNNAKQAGAVTVGITSFLNSLVAPNCDYSVIACSDEHRYPVEGVSARVAHICIIDALMMTLATKKHKDLKNYILTRNKILQNIPYKKGATTMSANKVILISIDGMRPDGFLQCKNPYIQEILRKSYYSFNVQTVMPSVTLPCHMSLFYSVPPARHGITTNLYIPLARPFDGLFERLGKSGKSCAMYYGWGPIRDVARPESILYSEFINSYTEDSSDTSLTLSALKRIKKDSPDFVFLYMVETDEKGGHDNGWMSEEYLHRISIAIDNVKKVIEACEEDYTIIITADHGGHDRTHGTDSKEDMTVPNFFIGKSFTKGVKFDGGSILNIAPTIAKLMDVTPDFAWEGRPIFEEHKE